MDKSREGVDHQFLSPWKGQSHSMFCYPWGWVILFYNRTWSSYFYRTDNRVNSFQLQKDKTLFDSCLKLKSPNGWACTIELPISYIVKSVWKPKRLTEWASSPRAQVSEMRNNNLFFFSACWSSRKPNSQIVFTCYLFQYETHVHGTRTLSILLAWQSPLQNSLEPFSRQITVLREARLREAKCERLTVNSIFRV